MGGWVWVGLLVGCMVGWLVGLVGWFVRLVGGLTS